MRSTTKRLARVTTVGGAVIAVAMLAFASTLQSAPSLRRTLRIPLDSPPPARGAAPRDTQTIRQLAGVVTVAPTDPPAMGTAVRRPAPEDNPAPSYPDVLLRAGVEGTATVRFVTDAAGVPDSSSIELVSATDPLFAAAVERVLPRWHLAPNATMVIPFTFLVDGSKTLEAIRAGGGQPAYVIDGVRVQTVLVVGGIRVPGVGVEPGARRGGPPQQWKQPAQPGQSGQPTRADGNTGFFEFKIDKEATPMPGNRGPRYPDAMRQAGIEGEVLAAFVIDTTGLPLMDTFKVLRSTDTVFTNTVRGALADMRFYPAEVGGRKVRQLIQMPFQFTLSKN